jgi:WD40 repeat protein
MSMNRLIYFVAVALFLPCAGSRLNANQREGYPLPVPWEIGRLSGQGKIGALDLSPDGKTLYALTWESGSRGWNLASGENVAVPPEEEAKLKPMRDHSNDGSPRPRPIVWEPVYESEPMTYEPHVVSLDGHTAYQATDDGSVQILDLTKRPAPRRWNVGDYNRALAVDPETGNLATGGHLLAWDVRTGAILGDQPKYELNQTAHPDCVFWQDHIPYGLVVLRAERAPTSASLPYGGPPQGLDQLGKLNLRSGEIAEKMPLAQNLYLSRSGRYLLSSFLTPGMEPKPSAAGKKPDQLGYGDLEARPSLKLYDADLRPVGDGLVMDPDSGTTLAAISPGDKFIVALGAEAEPGTEKGPVRIFDLATQKSVLPKAIPINGVVNVAVDDNGNFFAATKYGCVMEYQSPTGDKVAELTKAHQRPIEMIAISPDNKVLATLAGDDLIKLWSIPDLKPLGFIESPSSGQESWRQGLGFYDANTVFNMTNESTHQVRLIPINEAVDEATWNVDSSTSSCSCIAISADGKELAIGEDGGILTVIDNTSGKRLARVPAHPGGVKAVEFVGDTTKINSYGADGKCLTWDLPASANPITETDAKPTSPVFSVETGSGPKKIAQGDGEIIVSPAPGVYRQSELSPHYQFGFSRACPLPGTKFLALATWTNLYLYDLKTERVVWGYSVPSRPTGLIYDPLHHDLISSHQDGVTRRWAIPDAILQIFPK